MYALSPLFGVMVRAIGPRAASVIALTSTLTACAVIGFGLRTPVGFGIGLTVLGLGWSLGTIASSAALASVPLEDRLRTQGFADTLLNIGAGAASLLGGIVVGLAGYPFLIGVVGVCGGRCRGTRARADPSPRGRRLAGDGRAGDQHTSDRLIADEASCAARRALARPVCQRCPCAVLSAARTSGLPPRS
ncbi:hypothetical protein [Leifsonia xyli]